MNLQINNNVTKRAEEFAKWTNSNENVDKAINGEQVEQFNAFEFNPSTYSSDLKEFAQEYMSLFDKDNDGTWNYDEFKAMALDGQEIPDGYEAQFDAMLKAAFDNINFDNDNTNINAGEFASNLFIADIDWEAYNKTDGSLVDSLDGKLDFVQYQADCPKDESTSDGTFLKSLQQQFYNIFYNKD